MSDWVSGVDYPEWMAEEGLKTLKKDYLLEGETPNKMYDRITNTLGNRLSVMLEGKVEDHIATAEYVSSQWNSYFKKGWLAGSTPVLCNTGTNKGLPISCFVMRIEDSMESIFGRIQEMALLNKAGGATGITFDKVRGAGEPISTGGFSDGVVPFIKAYDSAIIASNQGCYDDTTEILTNKGWVLFENLTPNMKVMQVTDEGCNFVNYTDYIKYKTDKLINFTSESDYINLSVTGNHRMIFKYQKRLNTKKIENKYISNKKYIFPEFREAEASDINLHRDVYFYHGSNKNDTDIQFTPIDQFKVAYQADGASKPQSLGSTTSYFRYCFHFSKERKIKRFEEIVKNCGFDYNITTSMGTTNIRVSVPKEIKLSKKLSDMFDIEKFNIDYSLKFIDEISYWDGSRKKRKNSNVVSISYSCVDEENVDFLQMVCAISSKMSKKGIILSENPNKSTKYSLYISPIEKTNGEKLIKKELSYNGYVYCVTVPSGKIIVRSHGKTLVCGNSTRRGSASINLPIRHKDAKAFLKIRKPKGDVNRQCLNINHCVTIDDYFMQAVVDGDKESRELYADLISTRLSTGQPYIMYYHNVHNQRPESMVKRGLKIDGTNLCCLSGDTKVWTKEGIFEIKDLVGKTVTIFDGKNFVECNNFQSFGEDEVYRIHLKNGTYIDSNSNHNWYYYKNYNGIRKGRLKKAHTIDLQENYFLQDNLTAVISHGDKVLKSAYLKGFLIGDGTHDKDRPILNIHSTKYNCIPKIITSLLESDIEAIRTNCISEASVSEEVVNPNQYGKQIFKRLKGLTVRKKALIDFCTIHKHSLKGFEVLEESSKVEFLSGLLDADGCFSTSGIQISSVSKEFILDLQQLIFSFGFTTNLDTITAVDRNTMYRLSMGAYDSFEFNKIMKFQRLKCPYEQPNRRLTGYRRITKIEKLNNKVEVFCPNIPTTGKFTLANGIVTGNSEILIPHTPTETVVCCISSINLSKWEEFKDNDQFFEYCYLFLDTVMEEFICKAEGKVGMERALSFAKKSRAIGLGTLAFHTLLQSKNLPFTSIASRSIIQLIGKKLKSTGDAYNAKYSELLGNPEWCDQGIRNLTLRAIAPNTSSALICGGVSQGIEPIIANVFVQKTAKGTFIRINPTFKKYIQENFPDKDNTDFYYNVGTDFKGSIQHLDFIPNDVKEIFLTAYEINQLELVRNAAIWTKYIDQGISLNLFFPADVDPKWVSKCHITAWEEGVKTLYYVRTESITSRDMKSSTFDDCFYCQ